MNSDFRSSFMATFGPWTIDEANRVLEAVFDRPALKDIRATLKPEEEFEALRVVERLVRDGVPVPDEHGVVALLTNQRIIFIEGSRHLGAPWLASEITVAQGIQIDEVSKYRHVHREGQERTAMLTMKSGRKWKIKWPAPPQTFEDKRFFVRLHDVLWRANVIF